MKVYIYQAELFCEDCGDEIRKQLKIPEYGPPYDTGDYPYGPMLNGGGLADSPQHCGNCKEFLENPLTEEGEQYVVDIYKEGNIHPDWFSFYLYLFPYTPEAIEGRKKWTRKSKHP